MQEQSAPVAARALEDFRRARRQATLRQLLGRLTGQTTQLLAYNEVERALRVQNRIDRGLQEIPLDAIIGSVGRYHDFTRGFLPRSDQMEQRWARVHLAASGTTGWPPIEVYKLGDAYFVLDGNHRVSVARQLNIDTIPAYVTEIRTRVPLTPDTTRDDLIIQAEYADFLEKTNLDQLRPGAAFRVTGPGAYRVLLDHIDVHRYFMGVEQEREIPYREAATSWYDSVYLPAVQIIRDKGLLHDFPNRTETDLYIWLCRHRARLQEVLGWEITPLAAAEDLATQHSPKTERRLARVSERLRDAVVPDELAAGPQPGAWHLPTLDLERTGRAFLDILVPLSGEEMAWNALEQALVIARRERSRIRGLHVLPSGAAAATEQVEALRERFERRCQEAGVPGQLVFEAGSVSRVICDRARWNDVVVLFMSHPPEETVLARLGSGLRTILRRCPRPVLLVPGSPSPLERALVAYDGSPKAEEALYIAAYLAGRWQIELVVVTALDGSERHASPQNRARAYLEEQGIAAEILLRPGEAAGVILQTARERACDVLLIGGYGAQPVVEVVLGSTADAVLRHTDRPVLVCQ